MKLSIRSSAVLLSLIGTCKYSSAFTSSTLSFNPSSNKLSQPAHKVTTVMKSSVVVNEEELSLLTNPSVAQTEQIIQQEQVASKSYLDDGFVFGLEGSGLERPKGKTSTLVVEGDTLETQPYQTAIVASTFLAHFLFAANSIAQINTFNDGDLALTALVSIVTMSSSWLLADLGSGVLHWSVDNYGNGRTPIMGGIIGAFQGHHSAPWTITDRQFCNNVYKLCVPFGIPTIALINALAGGAHPTVTLFFTVFCTMEILSQEFHKWSHMTKGECSPYMNWLQNSGLTINRKLHALHHTVPYDGKYCIVSGVCNEQLDKSGFFRRLEHIVYKCNGVESNAWKLDPELKNRTLRGEYKIE